MEKQRNCWLFGLKRSAWIIALVSIPALIVKGVEDPVAYVFALVGMLAVGTLFLGGIECWSRRCSEKKQTNGD